MSNAENKAYEVYPKMSRISEPHGLIPADNKSHYLGDGNEEKREAFIEGYRQAEEDLELTWMDMECIIKNYQDIMAEKSRVFVRVEDYQELLKRFKVFRERKEK